MIRGDLQRRHSLRFHVPQEVHQVAAVGLDRVVDKSASQIQGTRAPAVLGVSPPVASRARARKASTLAAAGASPSRKSVRSGTRESVGRGWAAGPE